MKKLLFILVLTLIITGCRSEKEDLLSPQFISYQPGAITSPRAGDIFLEGSVISIRWTGVKLKQIRLDLVKKKEYYHQVIVEGHENNGSYEWVIPAGTTGSVSYQVKLTSMEDDNAFLYSDYFQIR
jgi:hypothetical protein